MKFLLDNWLLVLTAVVSGGALMWTTFGRSVGSAAVTAAEAVRLVNREKAVFIDVSEPAEYAQGHVAGARNIPLGSLETAKNLPANKALPVVLVCPNGARAKRGVGMLKKLGYEKATSLAGGLASWREASLPVEKSA